MLEHGPFHSQCTQRSSRIALPWSPRKTGVTMAVQDVDPCSTWHHWFTDGPWWTHGERMEMEHSVFNTEWFSQTGGKYCLKTSLFAGSEPNHFLPLAHTKHRLRWGQNYRKSEQQRARGPERYGSSVRQAEMWARNVSAQHQQNTLEYPETPSSLSKLRAYSQPAPKHPFMAYQHCALFGLHMRVPTDTL